MPGPSIPWDTVEDAIHQWVVFGSQLPTGQVVWTQQNSPRPVGTHITMRINNIEVVGIDWLFRTQNIGAPEGEEFEDRVQGMRTATLSLQCFSGHVDQGGVGTGIRMPIAILNDVLSASRLPSQVFSLNSAGVGIGVLEPVQTIDAILGQSIFEPRAIVDVMLHLASEITESSTFIESVEVNQTGPVVDQFIVQE